MITKVKANTALRQSLLGLSLLAIASPAAMAQDKKTAATAKPRQAEKKAKLSPKEGRQVLLRAYQKEYTVLAAEERHLNERLAELENSLKQLNKNMETELGAQEKTLEALKMDLEKKRDALLQLEKENNNYQDGQESLQGVLSQAKQSLTSQNITVKESKDKASLTAELDQLFSVAIKRLHKLCRIRAEKGQFFNREGQQVSGDLVHIGNIASLGVSEKSAGTLVPAGNGHLKLWKEKTEEASKALAAGKTPETLPLYLYETLEKGVEERKEKTPEEVVHAGGFIAYIIVGLGVFAAFLLIIRTLLLGLNSSRTAWLLRRVTPFLESGDKDAALDQSRRFWGAPARVMTQSLPHADMDLERFESLVSEKVLEQSVKVDRFQGAITVCAAVAPLLGLLGTVTGMIATFETITIHGTGDPKLLSGGISEALITTQLGLMVAIPALLWGNVLNGWAERINNQIEGVGLRLLSYSTPTNKEAPTTPSAEPKTPPAPKVPSLTINPQSDVNPELESQLVGSDQS